MKNTFIDKVKFATDRFIFHGKKFVADANEIFKDRINTSEEVRDLLTTRASVEDLVNIEKAIKGTYFTNGKISMNMQSGEYSLIDDYGFKLYNFSSKNNFISDEELLKVSDVINSIGNKPKYVFAINVAYKFQYYFKIDEGQNGSGEFVEDLKSVSMYLESMKAAGATWVTITDLANDIPDDVSSWAITFTVS